jgi:hypothetical protein
MTLSFGAVSVDASMFTQTYLKVTPLLYIISVSPSILPFFQLVIILFPLRTTSFFFLFFFGSAGLSFPYMRWRGSEERGNLLLGSVF